MKLMTVAVLLLPISLALPVYPAEQSGKAIFDGTCKNCHGPEGKGDAMADKFYQVQIPRLNSAYVQDKSDDELKEIITKGRRKMEPVKAGQPSAQHRLEPESVDAVIGYVRTLKKK